VIFIFCGNLLRIDPTKIEDIDCNAVRIGIEDHTDRNGNTFQNAYTVLPKILLWADELGPN